MLRKLTRLWGNRLRLPRLTGGLCTNQNSLHFTNIFWEIDIQEKTRTEREKDGEGNCSMGTESQFCKIKMLIEQHNKVNIVNTTELYTYKWLRWVKTVNFLFFLALPSFPFSSTQSVPNSKYVHWINKIEERRMSILLFSSFYFPTTSTSVLAQKQWGKSWREVQFQPSNYGNETISFSSGSRWQLYQAIGKYI